MTLFEYFDRVRLIHLPNRVDRLEAISAEIQKIGGSTDHPKFAIPHAPMCDHADGFVSKGVRGSFLSHYEILRDALEAGAKNVWILEDDAIFSRSMIAKQQELVDALVNRSWDLCFFGHSENRRILQHPKGLIPAPIDFYQAHCYAVNASVLPRVVAYLEENLRNPPGHPRGGRMYIDAAYTMFRRLDSDAVCLMCNPSIARQKGCVSSLNSAPWYDRFRPSRPLVAFARQCRDEVWRQLN